MGCPAGLVANPAGVVGLLVGRYGEKMAVFCARVGWSVWSAKKHQFRKLTLLASKAMHPREVGIIHHMPETLTLPAPFLLKAVTDKREFTSQ